MGFSCMLLKRLQDARRDWVSIPPSPPYLQVADFPAFESGVYIHSLCPARVQQTVLTNTREDRPPPARIQQTVQTRARTVRQVVGEWRNPQVGWLRGHSKLVEYNMTRQSG